MSNTLVLEVSAEVYEPLTRLAKQTGRTPAELATEWLTETLYRTLSDPVERFIGAFHSDIPDWADQHDRYLSRELVRDMEGKDHDEYA